MVDIMDPPTEISKPKRGRRWGKSAADSTSSQTAKPKRGPWIIYRWIFLCLIVVAAGFGLNNHFNQPPGPPTTAADIGTVYTHAVIVTVQPGDTLDSVVQTSFPNFLVEGKDVKEVARFQAEWKRLIALRSGLAGGNIAAGQRLALPALETDPGAIASEQIPEALRPKPPAEATTTTVMPPGQPK